MTPTKQQVTQAFDVVKTFAEAIREAGSIPSGHLYAIVMGQMSLSQYQQVIELLKRTGLVSESMHVLKWEGPR